MSEEYLESYRSHVGSIVPTKVLVVVLHIKTHTEEYVTPYEHLHPKTPVVVLLHTICKAPALLQIRILLNYIHLTYINQQLHNNFILVNKMLKIVLKAVIKL